MKKLFNFILSIILLLFSFYYTNKVLTFIKNKDPLMKQIKALENKYYQKPLNATIKNNTIIPGINGYYLNIDSSYKKLKRIKSFKENSLIIETKKPDMSLLNNIDKYIINGNLNKKNISIIINTNNLDVIKYYENTNINFILTKNFLLNNLTYLNTISNNIIVSQTDLIKNKRINYCYETDLNNLNICSNYNKFTIIPDIITSNYYYNSINKLKNGKILCFRILNNNSLKELDVLIKSINNLNYKIVSIDELIKE